MFRKFGFSLSLAALIFGFAAVSYSQPASPVRPRVLITNSIDENQRVALRGNTRPEANAQNDRGRVADDFAMSHMQLVLRRPVEREQALEKYIAQLADRKSPNFHHWMTAGKIGSDYGPSLQDVQTVTRWLSSHHFQINVIYPNSLIIDFSGTARQVREAFHTEIHYLVANGENHIANMSDPEIPTALTPVVVGFVSLHDFGPEPEFRLRPEYTISGNCGGSCYAVVPADLAKIYHFGPLFNGPPQITGQNEVIAVVEDANVTRSDWDTFRSNFGLSVYSGAALRFINPPPGPNGQNCDPPDSSADPNHAFEATLDAEWASAAAPGAIIEVASCKTDKHTLTNGVLIALENLVSSSSETPAIISVSYGQCEALMFLGTNALLNAVYQQAASEGISVYVSSGDEGAALCDGNAKFATHGIGVNGLASTAYNVAVGGTDFGDTYTNTNSTYWNGNNLSTYGSAISYIPEIPWNDSCASVLISLAKTSSPITYGKDGFCNSSAGIPFLTTTAGSGGPSGCATGSFFIPGFVGGNCKGYPKPAWQNGFLGNPSDGVRDLPDVSLFASDGVAGGKNSSFSFWKHFYVACFTGTLNKTSYSCSSAPHSWVNAGGTSFAAPIWAGIQALINQKQSAGSPLYPPATDGRQGNPAPKLYALASNGYGGGGVANCKSVSGTSANPACIFHDVTAGDIDVPCASSIFGTRNCFGSSIFNKGVLSTSNSSYQPAYPAKIGWDFATGIGTPDVANLVNNWPTPGPTILFSDDFNRPDGPVGNGWSDASGNILYNLVIQGGTVTTPGPSGRAGIYRPIDLSGTVTVSVDLTQENGFGGLLDRYEDELIFGNDGTLNGGYGVFFSRSDQNFSNSTVQLVLNNQVLATVNSSFQFGAQIHATVTLAPNGDVRGSVTGDNNTFTFDFGPQSIQLPGPNFAIVLEGSDSRSSVLTEPTVDNLVITKQ